MLMAHWLYSSVAFAAPEGCAESTNERQLVAALEKVEYAYADRDGDGVKSGFAEVNRLLACQEAPLDPDLAARVHRASALYSMHQKNLGDAELAFAASRSIDPGYSLPPSVVTTPGVELSYYAFDTSRITTTPLDAPRLGTLYIDGQSSLERPSNVPTVVQYQGKEGEMVWSDHLLPGEPLPAYPVGRSPVLGVAGIAGGVVLASLGSTLVLASCGSSVDICDNGLKEGLDWENNRSGQVATQVLGYTVLGVGLSGAAASTWWLVAR